MLKLFFSYSHKDEALRDTLEVHLAILKRQGLIQPWHDRRIEAGQEFAGVIDENLKDADIILLLVSPFFLNSDYCYEIEMQEALRRHEQQEAIVIPVVLEPCDWKHAPFGKLLVLPKDGTPVSKYPNQHDAFLEVVESIRRLPSIQKNGSPSVLKTQPSPLGFPAAVPTAIPRSSNLRLKKAFSERDKDDFLDEAFEYMARFFEGSLAELEYRNANVSCKFKRIDANHFTAFIYDKGKAVSECKIWLAGRGGGFGQGIVYAANAGSGDSSFNESMSVADDSYTLGLKPLGMSFMGMGKSRDEMLTPQGGAEHYWSLLIQRLQ